MATTGMAPDLGSIVLRVADLLLNRIWDPKVPREQKAEVTRFLGTDEAGMSLENPAVVGVAEAMYEKEGLQRRVLEFLTAVSPSDLNMEGLLSHFGFSGLEHHVTQIGRIVPCGQSIQGGQSIGHFSGTTGSIGCVVRDTITGGATYLLGCNHVIAALNQGTRDKDEIWAPGKKAGGSQGSVVGRLSKYKDIVMLPEMLATGSPANLMDAALCELKDGMTGLNLRLKKIGELRGTRAYADLETKVRKEGWKTGLTNGSLQMVGSILVHYSKAQVARFDQQFAIYPVEQGKDFAREGDSGSVVVDEENRVVGLLFAMAEGMKIGYANPIEPIFTEFGVEVVLA